MSLARTLKKEAKRKAAAESAGLKSMLSRISNESLSPKARYTVDQIVKPQLQHDDLPPVDIAEPVQVMQGATAGPTELDPRFQPLIKPAQ